MATNTVPFVILGWLVGLRRISDFFVVSAAILLIGGLGVWVIGPAHSVHAGASGLVFGYLGFLLLRGYLERSPIAILVAIVVGAGQHSALWRASRWLSGRQSDQYWANPVGRPPLTFSSRLGG